MEAHPVVPGEDKRNIDFAFVEELPNPAAHLESQVRIVPIRFERPSRIGHQRANVNQRPGGVERFGFVVPIRWSWRWPRHSGENFSFWLCRKKRNLRTIERLPTSREDTP